MGQTAYLPPVPFFLGRDATGTNNTNQVALGFNAQATMDNEMVLGGSGLTHIRNTDVGSCDLGTSTHPFKNCTSQGGYRLLVTQQSVQ